MHGEWMVWAVLVAGVLTFLVWVVFPMADFHAALARRRDDVAGGGSGS